MEVTGVAASKLRPSTTLQPGQLVSFRPDFGTEKDDGAQVEMPEIPVLYEDSFIVLIDKPPTIAVHPPASARTPWREPTVASWFAARREAADDVDLPAPPGEPGRPGIVHRLDRETSGVMVLAKTQVALEELRLQFKARTVSKEYRAVAYGEPRFDSDWIDKPLATHPRQGDRMVVARDGMQSKEASTFYEVVERFRGATLFACRPKTGRTHQIRVHMMSIGHSLVGDRAYRSRNQQHSALPEGAPDPGRHCLHAFRLALKHPRTGEDLSVEAPMPADLTALLDWFRAHR